jgi:hypothetical protein
MLIRDRAQLQDILRGSSRKHYVYVLRHPDGVPQRGGSGTPFYVGIGQGMRLFAHEDEAKDASSNNPKITAIRSIWAAGAEVIRQIDSFHEFEPWSREEELCREIGLASTGTGPLLNAQRYSPSVVVQGVEVRKYAPELESDDPDEVPVRFKLRSVRLKAGPVEPRSRSSVFGKIYTVAEANPGATGEELVRLLQEVDFTGNKSAYTQSGRVSAIWLERYLEGAFFRQDRKHLQRFG